MFAFCRRLVENRLGGQSHLFPEVTAIEPQELAWPRIIRRAFSDPLVPHESTGVHGRGTEEVKTNDVTGRVQAGEAGFTIEFGRPSIGVRFRDIEQVTQALAAMGFDFEDRNPVTHLMADRKRGTIREDILNEKILSAIVELKTTLENVPRILKRLRGKTNLGLGRAVTISSISPKPVAVTAPAG